ncbi:MAG: DUF4105 domain-containing protein [Muribaculaceae bacterium]|nr:DUF4105 domain-containing protein [Muribaculaceae bacterium]
MTTPRILLILCTLLVALAGRASDSITVSLATCYPGGDIYELEGHSALVISEPGRPDVAVTYGMFNFNAPHFVYRFVKGETDYMVGLVDWQRFKYAYEREGRRVVTQRLNLTPEQTPRLLARVSDDLRPENSTYRYNYVYDNCATRPLRAILAAYAPDSVTMGATTWEAAGDQYSFRDVMRCYHANYPWYQFGIDLALGSGIDYPLHPSQLAFCPMELRDMLAGATINGWPVVASEDVAVDIPAGYMVAAPTPWPLRPLTVCWAVFIVIATICIYDLRRGNVSRIADTIYFTIAALAGCLIAFLVFISVHEATSPNALIWWLNPFCFIPAIFIWLKKLKIFVFSYEIINFVVVFALIIASPWLHQSFNPAFYPLMLADIALSARYILLTYNKIKK